MTLRNNIATHTCDAFTLSVEGTRQGLCFVHQDVRSYSAATRRATEALLSSWDWLELLVAVEPSNSQLIKYSALYGFKYSYSQTSPDGVEYHILSRR